MKMLMQRRACERIPVNVNTRLVLGNMFFAGKITDISGKGLFIQTNLCPPPQAMFTILVQNENNLLQFFARVKWLKKTSGVCDGIGAEILNPSNNYLDFAKSK